MICEAVKVGNKFLQFASLRFYDLVGKIQPENSDVIFKKKMYIIICRYVIKFNMVTFVCQCMNMYSYSDNYVLPVLNIKKC